MRRVNWQVGLLFLCSVIFATAAGLSTCGCASTLDRARTTISTVATLERTAAEMVVEIDKDTQESIAAELDKTGSVSKAKADRDAWRDKRKQIRQALLTCHAAVVAGSVATELAASGSNVDLSQVIVEGVKALKALQSALAAFGVALPFGVKI